MGEYADYIIDKLIFGNTYQKKVRRRGFESGTGDYMWKKSDGSIIKMHDMDDNHLENAIRICGTKGNTGKEKQLREVLESRKDKQKNLD